MRYFVAFLFFITTSISFGQTEILDNKAKGTIINASTLMPLSNVNIINVNKVKGAVSNSRGNFEIDASPTDTLHITMIGYQSIKVKVTNDWLKNGDAKIKLTEKAIALIVNGFSKDVLNKLPMEFAVEAQKLLEISLEGSVG